MKKIIIAVLALYALGFGAAIARADDITVSGVNIKDLVSNTRIGIFLPMAGGATYKTIYTPVFSLHSAAGVEYLTLDVGAAAPGNISKGFAFASLGVRVDNLVSKAATTSPWTVAHVSAVSLPTLEAGIGGLLVSNKLLPGINLALRFGGK